MVHALQSPALEYIPLEEKNNPLEIQQNHGLQFLNASILELGWIRGSLEVANKDEKKSLNFGYV